MSRHPDAIVIGSGLNALGVVRSLGAGGLRVAIISQHAASPPQRSRYSALRLQAPCSGPQLMDRIAALVTGTDKPVVVFVTEEETVQYVAEQRPRFPDGAICRMPVPDVLLRLLDKSRFDDLCRGLGFPVPLSVATLPDGSLDLPAHARFPLIVKPAVKTPDYGQRFKKAYVVESDEEAKNWARKIAAAVGQAIVQEWIPGGDDQIYFCLQYLDDKGPVASFVGRKLRSWPPMYGGTSICTAAPIETRQRLTELTSDFFARTGFQGMGSMEFKLDPRDGTPFLIEPTVGRTDFQEEVATVNGVNIPLAAYCREVRRPLPSLDYRPTARTWMDNAPDTGDRALKRLKNTVAAANAAWRWSDPKPSLGAFRDRIVGFAQRRLRLE